MAIRTSASSATPTSKESSEISDVSNDGRPTSTPLNASPGTIVYGPAVSRGSQWDQVTVEVWHTDAAAKVVTLAVLDTDGTTVLSSTSRSISASSGPVALVSNWRLRNGLYLSVWWDTVSIGWAKVQSDQVIL